MAYEAWGVDLTFVAGESLAAMQYRFVHLADDDTVDMLDSGAEFPVGILQNAPANGQPAVVRVAGVSKLVMNDAGAVGALVKAEYVGASDNGKGAAATSQAAIRGVILKATGAEDDIATVLLCVGWYAT